MVEQVEEQGARPPSRFHFGGFGLLRPRGRSVRFPPVFNVLDEVGVFFAAWRGRDHPGGSVICAEVVGGLVPCQ